MSGTKTSLNDFLKNVDWSFLRSKEWFGYFSLVIVFSIVSVFLGMWQMDRRDDVLVTNARIINNWDQSPVSIQDIVPDPNSFDKDLTWRLVRLEGEYLNDAQTLARTRPHNGKPGFEILVPFQSGDDIVLVNRGWIQKGFEQDLPDDIPSAPSGEVSIDIRLRPAEPVLTQRGAPVGQVASIVPTFIFDAHSLSGFTELYGSLVSESAPADTGILAQKPELTEGPHLGYSLQWYVFAGLAYVALIYFIYTEARRHPKDDDRAEVKSKATILEPVRPGGQSRYVRNVRTKTGSDEEYEDNL